jgi:hypothetical protein
MIPVSVSFLLSGSVSRAMGPVRPHNVLYSGAWARTSTQLGW